MRNGGKAQAKEASENEAQEMLPDGAFQNDNIGKVGWLGWPTR